MTEEERQKKAAENARITQEAHNRAAEQIRMDQMRGERPVLTTVQNSVLEKLKIKFPAEQTPYDGQGSGEEGAE